MAQSVIAADVYIKTDDNEFGQGIFGQRGQECLVITPLHVVDNAFKIDLTLADKRKYPAELITSFPGDVSVLRVLTNDTIPCKNNKFFKDTQLDARLDAEQQGELRIMLADGSVRILPVNIIGFDKFRNIQVTPKESSVNFTKGESGSPLYIAGHFSGILLSVSNNIGTILRSDALAQTVSLFFTEASAGAATNNSPAKKPEIPLGSSLKKQPSSKEQVLQGVIAKSGVNEHKLQLEGNSPVRLSFLPTGDNEQFNVEVLDSARRIVFQNKNASISGTESVSFPFTPPTSDMYSIFILGAKGEGKYAFTVTTITTDAHLRGAANVLHIGGNAVQGILAHGAVAEYWAQLEGNSPIRLQLAPTSDPMGYSLDVADATGRSVYRDTNRQYNSKDSVTAPFTPPKTGRYAIRVKGTQGEGTYSLQLLPIASNAQLRGEANVLAVDGKPSEGTLAQGAVVEYRIHLEALRPVRFSFADSGDTGTFTVEIIDSTGMAVYLNPSRRHNGVEPFAIPFTAPKTDTYVLRLTGMEGECRYAVQVQPGKR